MKLGIATERTFYGAHRWRLVGRTKARSVCAFTRITAAGLAVLGCVSFVLPSAAQTLSAVPEAVLHYDQSIEAVARSSGVASVEPSFEEAIAAAEALESGQLDQFDDATYRKVQELMVGFWVTRVEVVRAAPNPDFFLKLAREKGTSVDQAFFEALKRTYPKDAWPAYKKALTDYGGCTVFDDETLTELYDLWLAFWSSHPERYRRSVRRELTRIEEALLSTCACGGEAGLRKTLSGFLAAHPKSRIAPSVMTRLDAVRNGTSEMRFHCVAR